MKKTIFLLAAISAFFVNCTGGSQKAELMAENDSLRSIIASRDAALDEMIKTNRSRQFLKNPLFEILKNVL